MTLDERIGEIQRRYSPDDRCTGPSFESVRYSWQQFSRSEVG
jgi:hypothetical protein